MYIYIITHTHIYIYTYNRICMFINLMFSPLLLSSSIHSPVVSHLSTSITTIQRAQRKSRLAKLGWAHSPYSFSQLWMSQTCIAHSGSFMLIPPHGFPCLPWFHVFWKWCSSCQLSCVQTRYTWQLWCPSGSMDLSVLVMILLYHCGLTTLTSKVSFW